MGPVQVLVVGFDRPRFEGEIVAEFARLRDAGVVRLVDLLLLVRREDGTVETLEAPEGLSAELGGIAAALLGAADGDADGSSAGDDATWSLADAVPPGSAAAIALVEHVWAEPLTAAITRAGGVPLEETWLDADDRRSLDELLRARAGTG
jgi:uncharacterized membrane protein